MSAINRFTNLIRANLDRGHSDRGTPNRPKAWDRKGGQVSALPGPGARLLWHRPGYDARLLAGFRQNTVVYRCVRMVAQACASVPINVREHDQLVRTHDLIDLLRQPNAHQSGIEFVENIVSFLLLHGNAYIEIAGAEKPDALYVLRPDRMRVRVDDDGWPAAYEYRANGRMRRYASASHPPEIIHVKFFDPQDDHYGLAPMETATTAIDIHNAANRWNKSLFDNAARPSGALVYRGQDGAPHLTTEQFDRLKNELETNFQGTQNAGRPILLEGGLDWSSISLSPQDMDFIAAKNSAARDIALAFGVPPMLLGIPGDNTYANYAEANRAFWRQTIVPLCEQIITALERGICRNRQTRLTLDLDNINALAAERQKLWQRLDQAKFLTRAEKRLAVGYPADSEAQL